MGHTTTPFFSAEGCCLCLFLDEFHSSQILLDYASWSAWSFLDGRRFSGFLHWAIVRGYKEFLRSFFVRSTPSSVTFSINKKSFRLFYFANANLTRGCQCLQKHDRFGDDAAQEAVARTSCRWRRWTKIVSVTAGCDRRRRASLTWQVSMTRGRATLSHKPAETPAVVLHWPL